MKKVLSPIVLVTILAVTAVACGSEQEVPPVTMVQSTIPVVPMTPTTADSQVERQICITKVETVLERRRSLNSQLQAMDTSSAMSIRLYVAASRSAIVQARVLEAECGHFTPAESSAMLDTLYDMEVNADQFEIMASYLPS